MSACDVGVMVVAAFLSGWLLNSLIRPEMEGSRWPLVYRYVVVTLLVGVLLLGILRFSWWHIYQHLPPWQIFVIGPWIASAGAAIQVWHRQKRERFHIPIRRKRNRQTV
jgi:hypothetical protein